MRVQRKSRSQITRLFELLNYYSGIFLKKERDKKILVLQMQSTNYQVHLDFLHCFKGSKSKSIKKLFHVSSDL